MKLSHKIDIVEAREMALNNILNSAELLMGLSIVEKFLPPKQVPELKQQVEIAPVQRRLVRAKPKLPAKTGLRTKVGAPLQVGRDIHGRTQTEVFVEVLEAAGKPITVHEAVPLMQEAGFRFASKNPKDSVTQCAVVAIQRQLVSRRKIDKVFHYMPKSTQSTLRLKE